MNPAHDFFSVTAQILGLVLVVAIVATLVSKKAQTASVVSAFGTAFSSMINAATQPVSGTNTASGLSLGF